MTPTGMQSRVRYRAVAQRSGQWWAVSVPELPGVFTQARRLSGRNGAAEMARDAISAFTGSPGESIEIDVTPVLPPDLDSDRRAVHEARERARAATEEAASQVEAYVRRLLESGMTVRDAGVLLELSPQRISQLAPQASRSAATSGASRRSAATMAPGQ